MRPRGAVFALVTALAALGGASPAAGLEATQLAGPGTGAGQVDFPVGITVQPQTQRLFVAEADNDRISEYAADGVFVRAFGFDVIPGGDAGFESCTAATGCKAGSGINGAGSVNSPAGIHAAANGHLYVAELDAERISEFDAKGAFVRAWGWDVIPGGSAGFEICTAQTGCKGGVTGAGAGQFFAPAGIASDHKGNIWVAENQNHRVSVFSPGGEFAYAFGYDVVPGGGAGLEVCTAASGCKAGVPGGGAGQLTSPRAVAFAGGAGGTLRPYVVEMANRVSAFESDGAFAFAEGWDVNPGGGAGFETCDAASGCKSAVAGAGAGQLNTPRGGAARAPFGPVLVADTGNDRITVPGDTRYEIEELAFDAPRGLAVSCRGDVYVGDSGPAGLLQRVAGGAKLGKRTLPCRFALGGVKLKRKLGRASLAVRAPSAGRVEVLGSKLVRRKGKAVRDAGTTRLAIVPRGKARRKLARRGRARVRVRVAFTPAAGTERRLAKRVMLRRR